VEFLGRPLLFDVSIRTLDVHGLCGKLWQGRDSMSTEALNRIIKEVNALTPQERRELIDRLAHEEQNSPLREWLTKARNMRAELPLTSDSVDTLRELREVHSRQ
jgi:hypothetical protein